MRLVLMLLAICLSAGAAFYAQTEGFTVVTTESARRASIAEHPRPLPPTAVRLDDGTDEALLDLLAGDGRVAIVNFIYTQCISLCLAMGAELQQLQQTIVERGLQDRVRLISLSFDPADTPQRLERYAAVMRADPQIWEFMAIPDDAQRKRLLDLFGIIVIPAPYGQFEHNAAYHVVEPDGLLSGIVDYGQGTGALEMARSRS